MNKQQLASIIWESANQMRSKIEANEYKDFILGFIFYRFLSEKERLFFVSQHMTEEEIKQMDESDTDFVNYTMDKIGYFIAYENLFSTWIDKGSDFDVKNVRDALSDFDNLINDTYNSIFSNIFTTLRTGLSKFGDTSTSQTKAIKKLLVLVKRIPMDGKQDYDVLGFIYEYLLSMFAANSGKKGGEFYTPHEVAILMSEIVAEHLKGKSEISIYDPTSGSGSLLITIGESISKRTNEKNKVAYYAQELIENTYNLTRMNLVMRGITPGNLNVHNGDTLEDDWPFFENGQPETYQYRSVDAVVSNPPYSQKWDPKGKQHDPRFADYGLAPKGKADYAFLLHDLYHLKDDGIMTIVLPHGVLFRGNDEGEIRKNLIEKNKIDTIIGLPANIFFGTSIATIIMVLKKEKTDTDILFIDASKGFVKDGKKNVLRSSDIKRIADTVNNRREIPGFSVRVSKESIIRNEYNLNISRYVDSFEPTETWDIRSIMFGGIPVKEVDLLDEYWDAFPLLKDDLFINIVPGYVEFSQINVKEFVSSHPSVIEYKEHFFNAFTGLEEVLEDELVRHYQTVPFRTEEEKIAQDIFRRMNSVKLIDPYSVYQILDDEWSQIRTDLEILQSEGAEALTIVDPNMVIKKKDNEIDEIQDGWEGRILPFELVQQNYFIEDLKNLNNMKDELASIPNIYNNIIDSLDEDELNVLDDNNTSFVIKAVRNKVNDILEDVETEETSALEKYLTLSKRTEKQAFIAECQAVNWTVMELGASGTYGKSTVKARIDALKRQYKFPDDSYEAKLLFVLSTIERENHLKKEIKLASAELHNNTKQFIETMSAEEATALLKQKWVTPIISGIYGLPEVVFNVFTGKLLTMANKYKDTFSAVEEQIVDVEEIISDYIGELVGSESDMEGLKELQILLGGEK